MVQLVQNATLRMAVEMGLPGAVASRAGKSVTAAELATETKGSKTLIGRRRSNFM